MKITILGCGGSAGVPMIGGIWGDCDPKNPKNNRTRASVLVEAGDAAFLIDTSTDLRAQLLRENVRKITAVLYTHAHGDHCHGIDDMRSVNWMMQAPIDAYGDQPTIDTLTKRFGYVFRVPDEAKPFYKPTLVPHVISGPIEHRGATAISFEQDHGYMKTIGYRIGNFAYSTDCRGFSDAAFDTLQGLDVWVVDAARRKEHPTHSHLSQTLEWVDRVKPKMAYLTHMGTDMDYETLCAELPAHIRPAYDGLKIEL